MLAKNPKVSVCIPTYNSAKYIGEAIVSVINQTFTDWEMIVCDNFSDDETAKIVTSFADTRVYYHRNSKNIGMVANFNRCIELAKGEYIYLFHADDVMLPSNLEKKVELLDKNRNVGMVHSNIYKVNGKGKIIGGHWVKDHSCDFIEDGYTYFEKMISGSDPVCMPSVMVRKECYDALGGYDLRLPYSCDYEMWMRIAVHYDVAYLSEPLAKYRWHESNETHKYIYGLEGVKQCYLSKKIAIERSKKEIQDVRRLLKEAKKSISKNSLHCAGVNCDRNNDIAALKNLWFAFTLSPAIAKNGNFLSVFIKICLGSRVRALARKLKKYFNNLGMTVTN